MPRITASIVGPRGVQERRYGSGQEDRIIDLALELQREWADSGAVS